MARKKAVVGLVTALSVLALAAGPACAQGVSARDRQSAAQAYDRGTAAYLAEDFADAARWFETAHRLAPAPAALIQAVRAYERAGNDLRVATLGLRLQALYPDEPLAQRAAQRALRGADRFVRIDVECEGCTVQVAGAVMEHLSFFVEPGREHRIDAEFSTGTRSETVRGAAGERRPLRFEAPPPPETEVVAVVSPEPERESGAATAPQPTPATSGGVPAWITISAAVATAVVGGVLIWSGVDALDGVPAYVMNPTSEALADGQYREARTNWLIGGTSVLAATTLLLAIFTDWGGEPAQPGELQASFGVQADGVVGGLWGRF